MEDQPSRLGDHGRYLACSNAMQFTVRHLLAATLLFAVLIASGLAYGKWLRIHQIDSITIDRIIQPLNATLNETETGWIIDFKQPLPTNSTVMLQLSTKGRNNNSTSSTFASVIELNARWENGNLRLTHHSASDVPPSGFAGLRFVPGKQTDNSFTYDAELYYSNGQSVANRNLVIEFASPSADAR